jgi:hypothetical protein
LAVILVAAIAVPLLIRASRRNSWRAEFSNAQNEVAWFARSLLPQLEQAGSTDQIAGGWAVASPRVAAAADALTGLEATAPNDEGRNQSRILRDAVRAASDQMQRLLAPGGPVVLPQDLEQIRVNLENALARVTVGPPI